MKNWEEALIGPDATLIQALAAIDRSRCQVALVVDAQRRLLGTLTDGDVRRCLLRGLTVSDQASEGMYRNPTTARVGEDRQSMLATMRGLSLHQIPILDASGSVVGLETVDDLLVAPIRKNWIVLMAGGLGARLGKLTRDTPKPMLKVGSRPLLETIVRGFADQGFRHFYFAVNYKAEQIESHFGDGAALGVEISYLRERERLGTAGALSLLPGRPELPLLATNADLLVKEDYGSMIERHVEWKADATMAVRPYEMQVPFGVVRERDGQIETIEEKPIQRFVVSAGMYVLSPTVLDLVPRGTYYDMPSLFDAAVREGLRTRCHHVDGYWLDVGRVTDYQRANIDFDEVFR
jgi:dTDP-glucose pyrophosphorylase